MIMTLLAGAFITVININPAADGRGLGRDGIDYGRLERRIERRDRALPYGSRSGYYDGDSIRRDYYVRRDYRRDRRDYIRDHRRVYDDWRTYRSWGNSGSSFGGYLSVSPPTGYE